MTLSKNITVTVSANTAGYAAGIAAAACCVRQLTLSAGGKQ